MELFDVKSDHKLLLFIHSLLNAGRLHLNIYSNGKGALPAYIALMHNVKTNEIYANYDVQTQMCSPEQLIEFQNIYMNVVETVLNNPEKALKDLF